MLRINITIQNIYLNSFVNFLKRHLRYFIDALAALADPFTFKLDCNVSLLKNKLNKPY
jgi:hypothetical protein